MVVGFIIVAVIPLIIICTLLVQSFKIIFSGEQKQKASETQNEINITVVDAFEIFNKTVIDIENNPDIIDFINATDNQERKKTYSALYSETDEKKELMEVNIYDSQGICKYSTDTLPVEDTLPLNWGILKKATENPEEISFLEYKKYLKNDKDETLLLGAKPIIKGNELLGFIVLEFHDSNFDKLFQGIYNSRNVIAIMSEYWEEIYISEIKLKESITEELRTRLFNHQEVEVSINGYKPYIFELPGTSFSIVLLQSEILSKNNFKSMYQIIFIFAIISLLLSLLVTKALSNYLISPVKQLSSAMNETKSGNFDIGIEEVREDEFSILYRDFNEMTHTIRKYNQQSIQNEKDLNEANIAMMHAQLNPHFLYNTLDTIKWSGVINHIPEISTMASSLAKILRMSISVDKFISLEDELSLVKSYMEIQKIRFDNHFKYECSLPDELKEALVPKLIVQPIVENSILHGLMESEEGLISVTCYHEGEVLFIEVIDNGCGIDKFVLENLNSKGDNKLKDHIGFYNINKIISLSYGDEYGLNVGLNKESGTRVVIRIPLIIGKENITLS